MEKEVHKRSLALWWYMILYVIMSGRTIWPGYWAKMSLEVAEKVSLDEVSI